MVMVRDNNTTIVQSNALIRGRYRLSVQERRIFYTFLNELVHTEDPTKEITINAPRLYRWLGVKSKNLTKETKKAVVGLKERSVNISEVEDDLDLVGIFRRIKYIAGTGDIKGTFDKDLLPHVLELTSHFAKLSLPYALRITSTYSERLYAIFTSYLWTGHYEVDVDVLKQQVETGAKFKRWYDFKVNVIEPAMGDLEELTDIKFTYSVVEKKGKTPIRLRFHLEHNKPKVPLPEAVLLLSQTQRETDSEYYPKADALLVENGIDGQRYSLLATHCDANWQYIYLKLIEVLDRIKKNKIQVNSLPAYLTKAVRDDYNIQEIQRLMKMNEDEVRRQEKKQQSNEEEQQKQDEKKEIDVFTTLRNEKIKALQDVDFVSEFSDFVANYLEDKNKGAIFEGSLNTSLEAVKASGDIFSISNVGKMLFFPFVAKKYFTSEYHSLDAWKEAQ